MTNPRIAPMEPPFAPEVEAALATWMPPGSSVPPLALFRTLAHHPMLYERMRPLGAGLLGRGTLPGRIRELLILRTSARCGARYEWGVHVAAYARAVGLDDGLVRETATAPPGGFGSDGRGDGRGEGRGDGRGEGEGGDGRGEGGGAGRGEGGGAGGEDDRLALRVADELHDRGALSDELFAAAKARFGEVGVLEMAAIAGFYHLIAFVIGTARVPLEPWAAPFPEEVP